MHPLREYLKKNKRSLKEFSVLVGSSPAYLCHIMAGIKNPSPNLVKLIEIATNGQVTPAMLRPDLAKIFSQENGNGQAPFGEVVPPGI